MGENQKFMLLSVIIIPSIIIVVAVAINYTRSVPDWDGDGYRAGAGDCDDYDKRVNRGLPEACADGLDNDCDRAADLNDRDCRDH